MDIFHSGAFSSDATVAIFGDEFEGGFGAACATPESMVGRAWFHDVETGALLSSFMIPRPQGEEICTVHNYNVIPTKHRDVLVAAWNLGGTSVIDFTDPTNPQEIGYVDVQENFDGRARGRPTGTTAASTSATAAAASTSSSSPAPPAPEPHFPYLNAQTQENIIG